MKAIMKKLILIIALLVLTSCTTSVQSPITGISYTGEIGSTGLSITAKPPFWDQAVEFWDWINSDNNKGE